MSLKNKNSEDDLREEYNLDELSIAEVGKGWSKQNAWAVCVNSEDKDLIPLKLYKVEIFSQLSKVRVINKNGQVQFYPQEWFLPVNFAKNVKSVLEQVA